MALSRIDTPSPLVQQRPISTGTPVHPETPARTQSAPVQAAGIDAVGNELRAIGGRIAEIERAGFESMGRVDQLEEAASNLDKLVRSITDSSSDALPRLEAIRASVSGLVESEGDSQPATITEIRRTITEALAREQATAESRSALLDELNAQLRGAVGVQTGAAPADFDAAATASALRARLLGQPAPTPRPPSGGIEPGQSFRLLGEA